MKKSVFFCFILIVALFGFGCNANGNPTVETDNEKINSSAVTDANDVFVIPSSSSDVSGPELISFQPVFEKDTIKVGEDLVFKLYIGTTLQNINKMKYTRDGVYADDYLVKLEIEYGKYNRILIQPNFYTDGSDRYETEFLKTNDYCYKTIDDFCSYNYPSFYPKIDDTSKFEEITLPSYIFTEEKGYVRLGIFIYGIYGDDIDEIAPRGVTCFISYELNGDSIVINQ